MSHRSDYMSGGGGGEIMLFGVRVKVDPMRKCVSMNNLSDYEPVHNSEPPVAAADGGVGAGYTSADDAVPQSSNGSRDRKRGVPWTEEEHKLFLIGLQKVGKGYWRGISKEYVKTRNPTQVASHAQKYFLRRKNFNRRRRRSSLFDITTDSVSEMPTEEGKNHLKSPQPVPQATTVPLPVTPSANGFSLVPFPVNVGPVLLSMQGGNPMENSSLGRSDRVTNHSSAVLVHPVPVFPMTTYSTMFDRNLNNQMPLDPSALSLSLSLSSGHDQCSGFQVISSSRHGDSFVSVA